MVPALESYVRDTRDILNKLENIGVDESCLPVGIDVELLYTSIPHEWGYKAV